MMVRDPLTERFARTLRETVRDPYDWWEGVVERSLLATEDAPRRRLRILLFGALYVVAIVAGVGLVAWGLWALMTL